MLECSDEDKDDVLPELLLLVRWLILLRREGDGGAVDGTKELFNAVLDPTAGLQDWEVDWVCCMSSSSVSTGRLISSDATSARHTE